MKKPSLHELRYAMAAMCVFNGLYHYVAGSFASPQEWIRVLIGVVWLTQGSIWMFMNAVTNDYRPK